MSCGAVAMAKTYAGNDAALTMGLIMAAHMVRATMQLAVFTNQLMFSALLKWSKGQLGSLAEQLQ